MVPRLSKLQEWVACQRCDRMSPPGIAYWNRTYQLYGIRTLTDRAHRDKNAGNEKTSF